MVGVLSETDQTARKTMLWTWVYGVRGQTNDNLGGCCLPERFASRKINVLNRADFPADMHQVFGV